VTAPAPGAWRPGVIHTYDDHRIAMCLSLAAFNPLVATPGTEVPVRILDPGCVAKTFPDYFAALFSVAQAAEADIPVITIDGPTASGKGTLASSVAQRLGWHQLDSGLVWRSGWAGTSWIPACCTAPRPWPRSARAWRPTTSPGWPGWHRR